MDRLVARHDRARTPDERENPGGKCREIPTVHRPRLPSVRGGGLNVLLTCNDPMRPDDLESRVLTRPSREGCRTDVFSEPARVNGARATLHLANGRKTKNASIASGTRWAGCNKGKTREQVHRPQKQIGRRAQHDCGAPNNETRHKTRCCTGRRETKSQSQLSNERRSP